MSSNHVTPPEIARALARHAPKSVTRVLDPAVGDGSLLLPLLDRVCHSRCEVTAVDIDPAAILSASGAPGAIRSPCENSFAQISSNGLGGTRAETNSTVWSPILLSQAVEATG